VKWGAVGLRPGRGDWWPITLTLQAPGVVSHEFFGHAALGTILWLLRLRRLMRAPFRGGVQIDVDGNNHIFPLLNDQRSRWLWFTKVE